MRANDTRSKVHSGARTAATLLLALAVLMTGNAVFAFGQQQQQKTFPSPEAATRALFRAVQSHDESALKDIVGAGSELVSTGDDLQDKLEREHFVDKYREMHRLVLERDKTAVLYLGAENWPFPIPLVSGNGVWRFDSQAGSKEVLCRRIGENEAMAIGAFQLLVLAEREYQQQSETSASEYARLFIGAKGARNGLDWKKMDSAISEELAKAGIDDQGAGGAVAVPFYGYYFRILTAQGKHARGGAKSYISNGKMTGGFAFIAYPAQYRSSGVKTFIAGSDGKVYEKDLGPETARIASSMSEYDPGPSWHVAEQYQGELQ